MDTAALGLLPVQPGMLPWHAFLGLSSAFFTHVHSETSGEPRLVPGRRWTETACPVTAAQQFLLHFVGQ